MFEGMFEKNEALRVGQTVVAHTPFGDVFGTVLQVAPTHSSAGDEFMAAEYGFTMDVDGSEVWAMQEDVTILDGEVK